MERTFNVEVAGGDRGVLLTLHGELDLSSCPMLELELEKRDAEPMVVIDLRELEFIDSTGLGVLVHAQQRRRQLGRELALVEGNGQVSRLLALTGLDQQLRLVEDPAELLGSY